MTSHQSTPNPNQARAPYDPLELDSFLNLDQGFYCSNSVSPIEQQPNAARIPVSSAANNTLLPPRQVQQSRLPSGPSYEYDSFPQQTGLPSGFISALNAAPVSDGFNGLQVPQINFNRNNSIFSSASDFDMDMPSPNPDNLDDILFPQRSLSNSSNGQYVNPSMMSSESSKQELQSPVVQSNVGRMYPGMHSQAALKAQQEEQARSHQRGESQAPLDDKISKLLSSVHQQSLASLPKMDDGSNGMSAIARMKKDEEDMDEDERLLASEEGKKLSSKERRQLRNKVSARAFRSRRKEYIGQLENEVAAKSNEVSDLRMHNRALLEENARLSDLTRMLLSSSAFSTFLDDLSNQEQVSPQVAQQVEHAQQIQRQPPKDVPTFQRPQVNMALIPDTNIDFASLDLSNNWDVANVGSSSWGNNQPQVFSVLEIPEGPAVDQIDMEAISGKSEFVAPLFEESEKTELPTIPQLPTIREESESVTVEESAENVLEHTSESAEVTPQSEERLHKLCGAANATRRRLEEMLL